MEYAVPSMLVEPASTEPSFAARLHTPVREPTPLVPIVWRRGPSSDAPILTRWMAGVGPAVIHHPTVSIHAGDDRPSGNLVVVSWNTNVGGGDLDGLLHDLRGGALTGGDAVPHFVVLLQEVFRMGVEVPRGDAERPRRIAPTSSHARTDIVTLAERHGLHLFYVPSMANGWRAGDTGAEDRGNAILSSLPLSDFMAIELPFEGQRRVAVSALIHPVGVHGQVIPWRVASVHLDNRSSFTRLHRSFGSGRTRQARALAMALVNDAQRGQLATIVGGDLNTWAPAAWEGAESLLRAHFPHAERVQGPTYAGANLGLGRTLDHLMIRLPDPRHAADATPSAGPADSPPGATPSRNDLTAPVRLADARGSDHYPLLTRLTLAH